MNKNNLQQFIKYLENFLVQISMSIVVIYNLFHTDTLQEEIIKPNKYKVLLIVI